MKIIYGCIILLICCGEVLPQKAYYSQIDDSLVAPLPDSIYIRINTSPDSTFLGEWVGRYLDFVPMYGSDEVRLKIDSIKEDSVFGRGKFTVYPQARFHGLIIKNDLYLYAKIRGNVIEGTIVCTHEATQDTLRFFTTKLNCYKLKAMPMTVSFMGGGILEGVSTRIERKLSVQGYFLLWRAHVDKE